MAGELLYGLYDNINGNNDMGPFYLDEFFVSDGSTSTLFPSFAEYPQELVALPDELEYYCKYPKLQKTATTYYTNNNNSNNGNGTGNVVTNNFNGNGNVVTNNFAYNVQHEDVVNFSCFNGYNNPFVLAPPMMSTQYYPSFDYLPDFLLPPTTTNVEPSCQVYGGGGNGIGDVGEVGENLKKARMYQHRVWPRGRGGGRSLRRHELSKLIPGASKLNTAQMFHAAYKYVKFLQAQIAILQLIQEDSVTHDEELNVLLTSPTIQEKLSIEEKCLVPKESLEILAIDREIQSIPFISKEIGLLVSSSTPTPSN